MVHRAADSRLLSNLLQQEKEYTKQLNAVLDSSNVSLASFAAYAAASPPPASHVIMAVTTSLAAADEALRRYARGVEEWRENMRLLKEAEEEVGNIMRDREILVTRMIKASKSQKSGTSHFRESLLLGQQRFPSSSSLSLSFNANNQDSPSPPPSRPLSGVAFSSSKLAAAQSELQACETHLAAKERELDAKRCAAVRDGMGARVRALMECGWAWDQHGKEALRALDELKVVENSSIPEEYQNPSLIPDVHHHHPDLLHPDDVQTFNHDSTRPLSDFSFSSIGPSQSASQVGVNHNLSPPVHMGSIMNSGLFGDPPPATATTRRFEVEGAGIVGPSQPSNGDVVEEEDEELQPPPLIHQEGQPGRPPSGQSTTTSSISISQPAATPTTYKVETMTYAQAVAVHVGPVASTSSPGPGPSQPQSHSPSKRAGDLFNDDEDKDVQTTMRIPAPHAIEGYAFEIPTAERVVMPVAGPSGLHYRHRSSTTDTPSVSGRSTPTTPTPLQPVVSTATAFGAAPPPVPMSRVGLGLGLGVGFGGRGRGNGRAPHVLTKRITEEELRGPSLTLGREREQDDRQGNEIYEGEERQSISSTEEDVHTERKLVQEGKLAVVENPRFMTVARRKELEKEERERERIQKMREAQARAAAENQAQVEARVDRDEVGTPKKEKKKFSLFHSHTPSTSQNARMASTSTPAYQRPDGQDHVTFDTTKPPGSSPGKGFFGSLKGFFSSKQSGPSSPSKSPSKARNRRLVPDSDSDDGLERTRLGSGGDGGGLQSLFRGSSASSPLKDKDKTNDKLSPTKSKNKNKNKWETRTDNNIREITLLNQSGRRGSFDDSTLSRRGGGGPGLGVGGRAVVNAGIVSGSDVGVNHEPGGVVPRGRAASDVGTSVTGKRLKKPRQGPPVSQSAFVTTERMNLSSSESLSIGAPNTSRTPAGGKGKAPQTGVVHGTGKGAGTSRRSASVDIVTSRKSWDEDEGGGGGSSSGDGMIVDLGRRRRRIASDVGVVDTLPGGGAKKGVVVPAAAPARESQSEVGVGRKISKKGYSSDTAAMASVPVAKKKSLTKKRPEAGGAATVSAVSTSAGVAAEAKAPPPVTSAAPILATSTLPSTTTTTVPVRKASVKSSSTSASKTTATGAHSHANAGTTTATYISANNENPSGTLVAQPGWNAHAGGALLSRNSSVVSAASSPGGPVVGGRGKKGRTGTTTSLGQGVGAGLERRASLQAPVGSSSTVMPMHTGKIHPTTTTTAAASGGAPGKAKGASGPVVHQPPPPAATTSLMSIVEDVTRANRHGWNPESDLRRSQFLEKRAAGGGGVGVGGMGLGMMEVPRAPAYVPREALEAMDIGGGGDRGRAVGSGGGGTKVAVAGVATGTPQQKSTSQTAMFEVKAPGSVFDQKPQLSGNKVTEVASDSVLKPVQTSTPKNERIQAQTRSQPTAPPPAAQTKAPLRSAMRSSSPSPSSGPVAGSSGSRPKSTTPQPSRSVGTTPQLPPPIAGPLSQDDGTRTKRSQDKGKGKAVDVEESGTTTDSESYETGNEYYSEEEHVERVAVVSSPATTTKTKTTTSLPNGHSVAGHESPKKASSDLSHSTTSTLLVGPSTSSSQKASKTTTPIPVHFQRPSIVSHASGSQSQSQTPRRRKSVRVSLQPMFSPSPPAMDYDYEEEQARYAPWNGMEIPRSRAHADESAYSRETPAAAAAASFPAPIPVRTSAMNSNSHPKAKDDVDVNDMWQDSGSDVDEEYTRAKRLLTRAAKREKDISLLVANQA